MDFEWDGGKRQANLEKHGIDFLGASQVFDGRAALEFASPRGEETRHLTVAALEDRLIAVVWTWRGKETIRIISARRARDGEERSYRQTFG